REYKLADRVVVLSTFAYRSFIQEGLQRHRLQLLLLGTSTAAFRPTPDAIDARCRRILSGEPLRLLYIGTLSFRKGMQDIASMLRSLRGRNFRFRSVGPTTSEVRTLKSTLSGIAEFVPKQPQRDLPKWYAWGDVFIFPTLED